MKRRAFLTTAGAASTALLTGTQAEAARLTSVRVLERRAMYRNRPDWPVPNDPHQVLYLQRSINRNTVVFALRFLPDGALDPARPVSVFWRRYEEGGGRLALRPLERNLAFGVDVGTRAEPGQFNVAVRSLPQMPMVLVQTAPGQAQLYGRIGGKSAQPIYAFAEVIDGLTPRVTGLWLHGPLPTGPTLPEPHRVEGREVRHE